MKTNTTPFEDLGSGVTLIDTGFGRKHIPLEEGQERFDEAIEVIRKSWTTKERWSHKGKRWSYNNIIVEPPVLQQPHPPLWIGAVGPEGIKRAARGGFSILLDQVASVEQIGERVRIFKEECELIGRQYSPDMVGVTRGLYMGHTRDAEDVLADLRDRGLVQQNGEKFVLTQAGFGAREAILRHLRDFDAEQMSPFTPEEVQAARRVAANKAYEQAGVGPGDVNVAEVHDATAFAEILHVENLGFCQPDEGGRMAETGETRLGGRLPVNPSGGLVSKGHPIAATGAMQIHELVTQLRGEAGARQVPNARIAAAENGGGFFGAEEAATVVTLLGR